MKKGMLRKLLCTCVVTAAAFAATTISASACTTIYVGGDLVEEGTPFIARTEDYGSDYNNDQVLGGDDVLIVQINAADDGHVGLKEDHVVVELDGDILRAAAILDVPDLVLVADEHA
mgnify:CR=1 FL=1